MSNTSTAIRAIEHDGTDMYVTFQSGAKYRYPGVDVQTAKEFSQAPSKGQFFNRLNGLYDTGVQV